MNTSKRLALLLTGAIALAACGTSPTPEAGGASPVSPTAGLKAPTGFHDLTAGAQGTGRWFIELAGEPSAVSGISAQSVLSEQAQVRALAQQSGLDFQEFAQYTKAFNGLSVVADRDTALAFSRLPGVKNVFPVVRVELPRTERSQEQPEIAFARGLTGVDTLYNELGLTGQGVRVAVMDSGIDLEHPAFAGRVVAGYDFVGDEFGSEDDQGNVSYKPKPDDNPDDCGGHGTHVAGIIGGNDPASGFRGVAPGVSFGAYKVFGCDGSTTADIMISAMERALDDNMDVLNMSIGASFQWPNYPTATAANSLVKAGMVVTVSAGNSGTSGQYATGSPSLGDDVISVASVDNDRLELQNFTLNIDGSRVPFNPASGAPPYTSGSLYTVVKNPASTVTTTNDGCTAQGVNPLMGLDLKGKAVLIRRGTCTFREKVLNAKAAGASGVLLYNNTAGFFSPTVAASSANDNVVIDIPVAMLTKADGERIAAALTAGQTVTVFTNPDTQTYANPTGNTISDFSSYGASPDLNLKPDLAAPGGSIRSTYPLTVEPTGYAVLSGTSMAAPHVAGIAALMLQARPDLEAKDMRVLLQNTSSPRNLFLNNVVRSEVTSVQKQGAGQVSATQAYGALMTGAKVTPSKLALGESDGMPSRTRILVLRNNGPLKVTYSLRHVPGVTLGLGKPAFDGASAVAASPALSTAAAEMTVNGTTTTATNGPVITLAPFSEAELTVKITAPSAPTLGQYGGYLTLYSDTSTNLTVPYSGFIGDFQRLPVLTSIRLGNTIFKTPLLYDPSTDMIYQPGEAVTEPIIYTFAKTKVGDTEEEATDRPTVYAHFGFQARRVDFDLLAFNGELIQTIRSYDYVSRNGSETSGDVLDEYVWNGKLANGDQAPDGQYMLRLRVLKSLGDPSNPDHYETYVSQPFKVQRAR